MGGIKLATERVERQRKKIRSIAIAEKRRAIAQFLYLLIATKGLCTRFGTEAPTAVSPIMCLATEFTLM